MCNKRITYIKFNSVNSFKCSFKNYLLFFVIILAGWGCADVTPLHSNEIIKTEFPKLADAIIERDTDRLLGYVEHQNEFVRSIAWRALAKSEVENSGQLFDKVLHLNTIEGWFALSYVPLQPGQLNRAGQLLRSDPAEYSGSCEVFRRQGKGEDAILLLSFFDLFEEKERCATAIGTIVSREEISEDHIRHVIESSFNSENIEFRNNLLYGFYRSAINRPVQGSELFELLEKKWLSAGIGADDFLDQYMIRILGEAGADRFLIEKGGVRGISNIQLLIELVQSLQLQEQMSIEHRDLIKSFLTHQNPQVVVQILERLKQQQLSDQQLVEFIYSNITIPTRNHEIFLISLEYLQQNDIELSNLMNKITYSEKMNPYLTDRILGIYKTIYSSSQLLLHIQEKTEEGGVSGMHAMRFLTGIRAEDTEDFDASKIHHVIKSAVQNGNISVLSAMGTLLSDETLISEEDYDWIYTAYTDAVNQNIQHNMDVLEQALNARFPDRFEQPANETETYFRIPDWERLYVLGTRPVWRLNTVKGSIEIRIDPLTAPFTVSSIDSLTSAGLYDGVAFHRVVRNFVVQGGDFARRDGFGSPGYTLPTEPSLHSFSRGRAGIASSGTDTEGSQYFFMHQWAPHLDGDYTLFGEVINGMDVVDRLQIGDKVISASIYPR